MGQRELLLMLGALIIFGLTVVRTNDAVITQDEANIRREYEYYALSQAQAFIEEANARAFDLAAINNNPLVPDDFTAPNALGPATGETYPNFNDVDDFNGYADTLQTARGEFAVSIAVGYVQASAPDVIVNQKTIYKKMTVSISNEMLQQPVQLSYVFGYLKN